MAKTTKNPKTKTVGGQKLYLVPKAKQSKNQQKLNDGNYFRKGHLTKEQREYHGI